MHMHKCFDDPVFPFWGIILCGIYGGTFYWGIGACNWQRCSSGPRWRMGGCGETLMGLRIRIALHADRVHDDARRRFAGRPGKFQFARAFG